MTQIIEPNEKSDLKQDVVRRWLSQKFTGILSGFNVTNGTTGFKINIDSGVACINGVDIDDDESRLDFETFISSGADKHYIVYGQHTPAASFPAPPMTITVDTNGDTTVPPLPADSVKIADIFVPAAAADITDCRIVVAPKLPDRGVNDSDVIVERLMNSNMNVIFGGGGGFTHNSIGNTLTWSDDIDLIATTITNKERFQSVPLAAVRILAGSLGPTPTGGEDHGAQLVRDNCILFAVMNREIAISNPAAPDEVPMHVLDLDNPDIDPLNADDADLFYDPTRERIVVIGAIIGGVLKFRSGISSSLPPPVSPADPPAYFLRNDPGGNHYWSTITEDLILNILTIGAFTASPNIVEVGVIVNTPSFTASYNNGPATFAELTEDTLGASTTKNVSGTPTAFSADGSFQKMDTNEFVRFNLEAHAGDTPDNQTEDIHWYRYLYWGIDNDILAATEGNLKNLNEGAASDKALRSGKSHTFTKSGLVNQYVYFGFRAPLTLTELQDNNAFGASVDTEFVGLVAAVGTENGLGNPTNYNLYRTKFQLTGNVNFTIT